MFLTNLLCSCVKLINAGHPKKANSCPAKDWLLAYWSNYMKRHTTLSHQLKTYQHHWSHWLIVSRRSKDNWSDWRWHIDGRYERPICILFRYILLIACEIYVLTSSLNAFIGSAAGNWKVAGEWQVQGRRWECSWRSNGHQLFASWLLSLDLKDAWRERAGSWSIDACPQPTKHGATLFDWSTKVWQTWFSTRSLSVSQIGFYVMQDVKTNTHS